MKKILIICGIILVLILAIPIKDTIIVCLLRQHTTRALAKTVDTLSLEFKDNQYINAHLESIDLVEKAKEIVKFVPDPSRETYSEEYRDYYVYSYTINLMNSSKYNIFVDQANKYLKPKNSIDFKDTKTFYYSVINSEEPIKLDILLSVTENVSFKFIGKDMSFQIPICIGMTLTTTSNGESGTLEFSGASASIPKKDFINAVSMFTSKMYKVDDSDSHIVYKK